MIRKLKYLKVEELVKLKIKFAGSSILATTVDYILYQLLVYMHNLPAIANLISSSIGMLINFVSQKKFIFKLERKLRTAFIFSIMSSLLGLSFSTVLIHYFNEIECFNSNQLIIKAIVTGLLFFYNFYMKRFAFERRIL